MILPYILRYLSCGLAIGLAAIGTGIGQGIAGRGGIDSLMRQTFESQKGFRALLLGLALTETGTIFTLVMTMLLIFSSPITSVAAGLAELGIGLSLGITAAVVSYASSMVVKNSCISISRQPFFAPKLITFMLLVQSIVEAPVIFSFVISIMIWSRIDDSLNIYKGVMLFCAGLVLALGAIGPAIGQSFFAASACRALGLNKNAYGKIFPFTLLNQAIIETPVIFSLLLAFTLVLRSPAPFTPFMSMLAAISAIISMGIGSTGTGIATARVASQACLQIARNPDNYGVIFRISLLSQGLIESAVIYCLIVAIIIVNWY